MGGGGGGGVVKNGNKSHFVFSSHFILFGKIYIITKNLGGGGGFVKNQKISSRVL